MYPIIYKQGSFVLYSYPFIMGIAWALGHHLVKYYFAKSNVLIKNFNIFFWGMFASVWIGAKILYLINSAKGELITVATNSSFWLGGGFVFYGGLIGAIIFVALFARFDKTFSFVNAYLLLPVVAIGHSIGRIGCFMAGCCYGVGTNFPITVHMHGADRHPVQLYESFLLFILFLILHFQVMKQKRPLLIIASYLSGYSVIRFALEFFRGDQIRGVYAFGLSSGQFISIIIFLISMMIIFFKVRNNDK